MIELVSVIVPFLDDGEDRIITKSYVITNKKLLANAVYIFEKNHYPCAQDGIKKSATPPAPQSCVKVLFMVRKNLMLIKQVNKN